jgi:lysophospholipase L1-like esterase
MTEVSPPRGLRFSRAIAVAQAAVLLTQGRRLRRDTPRLADAPLPWSGRVEASRADDGSGATDNGADDGSGASGSSGNGGEAHRTLHLLVIGDSTAAGVGVDDAELGLGGQLARALAARTGRPVEWRAVGRNGATARDLVRHFMHSALEGPADLVFLSVGANDALGLRSARAFRSDVGRLVGETFAAHPAAVLLMSSLPAFFRFQLLPDPLRRSLYRHSQALERVARTLVDAHPRAHMSPPPPPYTEGFFATDDFHPSAIGYKDWAGFAIDNAWGVGFDRLIDER